MKHTIIESDRLVIYLHLSDDGLIRLEACSACQLRLNKAAKKFIAYQQMLDKKDDEYYKSLSKDERISLNIDRIKYFIDCFDIIDVDTSYLDNESLDELSLLNGRLSDDDLVLATFTFNSDTPNAFEKVFMKMFQFYGMTMMDFLMFDVVTLTKKVFDYIDFWDDDDSYIKRHKKEYFSFDS